MSEDLQSMIDQLYNETTTVSEVEILDLLRVMALRLTEAEEKIKKLENLQMRNRRLM